MSKKLDILWLYLDDYNKTLNGRSIAKKINVSPQTGLSYLKDLTSEGILRSVQKGRNNEYSLNLMSIQARLLLNIAEYYKSLLRLENKELRIILEEMIPYSESIILFGSFSDFSETKDSDIDLIAAGRSDVIKVKQISKKYSRKINIEFVSYNEFRKTLNLKNALAIEILKKHIIYGNIVPIINIFIGYYLR